jgi:hypothetical protein
MYTYSYSNPLSKGREWGSALAEQRPELGKGRRLK